MRKKSELNCPNCGAPITGEYCPYCGSVFYDWAALDMDEPKYIKLKLEKELLEAKIESLKSQQDIEAMFKDAIAAMKRYRKSKKQEKVVDEQTSSGKLDLIIKLPYLVKGGRHV